MSTNKKMHWKQALAQSRQRLLTLLTSLTTEQWQTPVYDEGQTWTVLDLAAHLMDTEKGMSIQIHKIRKGRETVPEGFDLDGWNAGLKERVGAPTPAEVLAGLEEVRARTLAELASLNDEEWQLSGRHPSRGIITIEQYYETIAWHETHHGDHMRQALQQ